MNEKKIVFRKTLGEHDELDPIPMIHVKEFDLDSAMIFARQIATFDGDQSVEEIFLHISSYGGEAMALMSMMDSMLSCSKPIHSIVSGPANSCGAFLAIAAPGKRYIGELSSLHLHHIRSMVCDDLPGIQQEAKILNKIESKLFRIIAKRCNTTVTALKKRLKDENREWNVGANEALELSFSDVIGSPKLSSSLVVECEY